jgi:hypothetical protein
MMDDGDRFDRVLERRRHHGQPFDSRQHRNRRRDHRIAVEHRGCEHAGNGDRRDPAAHAGAGRALCQRCQRERPALAIVVEAQHDEYVLERNDQRDRPEQRRQGGQHIRLRQGQAMIAGKRFLECVKGTRADIPEHHAQRCKHQGRDCLCFRSMLSHFMVDEEEAQILRRSIRNIKY